jgi:hypothetical protein
MAPPLWPEELCALDFASWRSDTTGICLSRIYLRKAAREQRLRTISHRTERAVHRYVPLQQRALSRYARVSTIDQNPALQLDALSAAGCAKVFEDRASGARADRAGLRSVLDYVRDGGVLIVWKLDRLGRSLPHLIEAVTTLEKRGVGFRSITDAIDTTTPWGTACVSPVRRIGSIRAPPPCARPHRAERTPPRTRRGCACVVR